MFYRVNVDDAHHVDTSVTDHYYIPRYIEAPTAVETIVGYQTMLVAACEDGVVVLEGVLRVRWEVGKPIPLKAKREPFS